MRYSIFMGRFQPFHNGHLNACDQGLQSTDHIIILVGSAFSARGIKNPFTFDERRAMISGSLDAEGFGGKYTILPIKDYFYSDNAWISNVQKKVGAVVGPNDTVSLIGLNRDSTSYYLKLFPKWGSMSILENFPIHATDIRKSLLQYNDIPTTVPDYVAEMLKTLSSKDLKKEWEAIDKYKLSWSASPYDPIFVTTDAVVVSSGHVLLIKRRGYPGKGLLALPGGFVQPDETLESGCIRELKEETKIDVPKAVLVGHIKRRSVFDYPFRSVRERTITHAFYIELDDVLPKVKGGDDAAKAMWTPLNELNMEEFFEDHYQIINSFIGGL